MNWCSYLVHHTWHISWIIFYINNNINNISIIYVTCETVNDDDMMSRFSEPAAGAIMQPINIYKKTTKASKTKSFVLINTWWDHKSSGISHFIFSLLFSVTITLIVLTRGRHFQNILDQLTVTVDLDAMTWAGVVIMDHVLVVFFTI